MSRGHREPHDGVGVGVRLDDLRRVDFLGQVVVHARDRIAHVGRRDVQVDAVVEFRSHPAAAEGRLRRDGADPGHARDGALDDARDFPVDRLGRRAGEVRAHGDDWPVDVRQLADFDAEQRRSPATAISVLRTKARTGRRTNSAVMLSRTLVLERCSSIGSVSRGGGGRRLRVGLHRRVAATAIITGCPSRTRCRPSTTTSSSAGTRHRPKCCRRCAGRSARERGHPHRRARPRHRRRPCSTARPGVDGRIAVARKLHRGLERHAGPQLVIRVRDPRFDLQGAAVASIRLSTALISPAKRSPGRATTLACTA